MTDRIDSAWVRGRKTAVDRAVRRYNKEKRKLTWANGEPRYPPSETAQREADLLAELDATLKIAMQEAIEAGARLRQRVKALSTSRDPLHDLDDEQLTRAQQLASFIREEFDAASSDPVQVERGIEQAIFDNDPAKLALYLREIQNRTSPIVERGASTVDRRRYAALRDKLEQAVPDLRTADRQRAEAELDRTREVLAYVNEQGGMKDRLQDAYVEQGMAYLGRRVRK